MWRFWKLEIFLTNQETILKFEKQFSKLKNFFCSQKLSKNMLILKKSQTRNQASASRGLDSNFEGESSPESLMPSTRPGKFWISITCLAYWTSRWVGEANRRVWKGFIIQLFHHKVKHEHEGNSNHAWVVFRPSICHLFKLKL